MTLEEKLPLDRISSPAQIVLLGPDGAVLSHHDATPSAVQALSKYTRQNPGKDAQIYRRTRQGWVVY